MDKIILAAMTIIILLSLVKPQYECTRKVEFDVGNDLLGAKMSRCVEKQKIKGWGL